MKIEVKESTRLIRKLCYEIEPFLNELILYALMIFVSVIVSFFTGRFIGSKLKEVVFIVKEITFIAMYSLFGFHILGAISIRVVRQFIKKLKIYESETDNNNDSFWAFHSIAKTFIVRGFELTFLTVILTLAHFYFSDWSFLVVLPFGILIIYFFLFV